MANQAKYLIFKIDIGIEGGEANVKLGELVTDGTVIRRQDKLAATTLETYAALAQGAIEILEEARSVVPFESAAYDKINGELEGLHASVEYMQGEADKARREARKFPD